MKRSIIFIALFAFLTLIAFVWQQRTFGNEKYERIVDSDGKGYVAYLPAIFILMLPTCPLYLFIRT